MDRLCAYTGWPVGHVYLAVAPDMTRWAPTAIWHLAALERFTAFQQATQSVEFAAGEGLVGRVGALGKAEWSADITSDSVFYRWRTALEVGLTAGVAVPILAGPEVVGVLAFYTDTPLPPNLPLLETITQIGTQLGPGGGTRAHCRPVATAARGPHPAREAGGHGLAAGQCGP